MGTEAVDIGEPATEVAPGPQATVGSIPTLSPASPSKTSLAAFHLQKSYAKRRVVDNVSLYVEQGAVVGLLGANGAGKTTTFYTIIGLERPARGNIVLCERAVTRLPMHLRD